MCHSPRTKKSKRTYRCHRLRTIEEGAPLAHLALALIGEGEVFFHDETRHSPLPTSHYLSGQPVPARAALAAAGVPPLTLQAKEGLVASD